MLHKELKTKFYKHCLDIIEDRLLQLQKDNALLQEAKLSETKSSAGDKYETGMAMIQNQEALLQNRILETQKIKDAVMAIKPELSCEFVANGALVELESGLFYVIAGMGKLSVQEHDFFAISLASPIGMAMKNKKASDLFLFNDKFAKIKAIY